MKSLKFARLAAVAAVILGSGAAFAADSATLNVSATINGICKFTTTPTGMSFTLDPSSTAAGAATATFGYKCTKGQLAGNFAVGTITDGTAGYAGTTAANTALVGQADATKKIPYAINWTTPGAFTGSGFGVGSTENTVQLNGSILNADYVNMPADTYKATVSVTIAP